MKKTVYVGLGATALLSLFAVSTSSRAAVATTGTSRLVVNTSDKTVDINADTVPTKVTSADVKAQITSMTGAGAVTVASATAANITDSGGNTVGAQMKNGETYKAVSQVKFNIANAPDGTVTLTGTGLRSAKTVNIKGGVTDTVAVTEKFQAISSAETLIPMYKLNGTTQTLGQIASLTDEKQKNYDIKDGAVMPDGQTLDKTYLALTDLVTAANVTSGKNTFTAFQENGSSVAIPIAQAVVSKDAIKNQLAAQGVTVDASGKLSSDTFTLYLGAHNQTSDYQSGIGIKFHGKRAVSVLLYPLATINKKNAKNITGFNTGITVADSYVKTAAFTASVPFGGPFNIGDYITKVTASSTDATVLKPTSTTGTVNVNKAGDYPVTYTYTNGAGLTTTVSAIITVAKQLPTAPVVTLNPAYAQNLTGDKTGVTKVNSFINHAEFTATLSYGDTFDANKYVSGGQAGLHDTTVVTPTSTNTVNTGRAGSYNVTYTYTNADGLTTDVTGLITVGKSYYEYAKYVLVDDYPDQPGRLMSYDGSSMTDAGQKISPKTPVTALEEKGNDLYVNGTHYYGIKGYNDSSGNPLYMRAVDLVDSLPSEQSLMKTESGYIHYQAGYGINPWTIYTSPDGGYHIDESHYDYKLQTGVKLTYDVSNTVIATRNTVDRVFARVVEINDDTWQQNGVTAQSFIGRYVDTGYMRPDDPHKVTTDSGHVVKNRSTDKPARFYHSTGSWIDDGRRLGKTTYKVTKIMTCEVPIDEYPADGEKIKTYYCVGTDNQWVSADDVYFIEG